MKKALIIAVSIISVQHSFAQWSAPTNFGNGFVSFTTSTITGIGIGTFTSNISSALHINTTLTAPQTGVGAFGLGEVFRTDAPSGVNHRWRMFTNGSEIFRIENPSSAPTQINILGMMSGLMNFSGNGLVSPQFTIDGSTGYIGIGTNAVNYLLQLKQIDNTQVFEQFTNQNTGTNSTDGFRIGITSSNPNIAELRQYEEADMNFLTFNTQRMTIKGASGFN